MVDRIRKVCIATVCRIEIIMLFLYFNWYLTVRRI